MVALCSGRVVGVEALVRWQHPIRGLLPPSTFLPQAEANGFILAIDAWALQAACRTFARWLRTGDAPEGLRLSVNLSARSLARPFLAQRVEQALQTDRLEPARLQLELTETAPVRDVDGAVRAIEQVRSLGVRVALDDFGAGYSLRSLRHFKVDVLKLDRLFTQHVDLGGRQGLIARAAIALAQAFDLPLIAEGVETPSQAAMLRELGCSLAQGYLFSGPLPPELVGSLLRRKLGPATEPSVSR